MGYLHSTDPRIHILANFHFPLPRPQLSLQIREAWRKETSRGAYNVQEVINSAVLHLQNNFDYNDRQGWVENE